MKNQLPQPPRVEPAYAHLVPYSQPGDPLLVPGYALRHPDDLFPDDTPLRDVTSPEFCAEEKEFDDAMKRAIRLSPDDIW